MSRRRILGPAAPRRVDVPRLPRPRTRLEELEHRIAVLDGAEHLARKLDADRQRARLLAAGVSV